MRQLTVTALETVTGIEVRLVMLELGDEPGAAVRTTRTSQRNVGTEHLGADGQELVEAVAEELFNAAYIYRG